MAVFVLCILILVLIAGLSLLAYRLAVFAAPFMAGLAVAKFAHGPDTGLVGAILIGAFSAIAAYALLTLLFVFVSNLILRILIGLAFVIPAMMAGYALIYGITGAIIESDVWRQIFSIIGAITIGIAAGAQLMAGASMIAQGNQPTPKSPTE